MVDVFISYKSEDVARVEQLAGALRRLSLDVWFDKELPAGESYTPEIAGALQAAKCVVVCWTRAAAKSEFVLDEARRAGKRLVPVFLEQMNADELPVGRYAGLQTENLSNWRPNGTHAGFLKVLLQIGRHCGRPALAELARLDVQFVSNVRSMDTAADLQHWLRSNPRDPGAGLARSHLDSLAPHLQRLKDADRKHKEAEDKKRRDEVERDQRAYLKAREAEARARREHERKTREAARSALEKFLRVAVPIVSVVVVATGVSWWRAQPSRMEVAWRSNAITLPIAVPSEVDNTLGTRIDFSNDGRVVVFPELERAFHVSDGSTATYTPPTRPAEVYLGDEVEDTLPQRYATAHVGSGGIAADGGRSTRVAFRIAPAFFAAASTDGTRVLTYDVDGYLALWDVRTAQTISRHPAPNIDGDSMLFFQSTPDFSLICLSMPRSQHGSRKGFLIWSVAEGRVLFEQPGDIRCSDNMFVSESLIVYPRLTDFAVVDVRLGRRVNTIGLLGGEWVAPIGLARPTVLGLLAGGECIAITDFDANVRIVRLRDGVLRARFRIPKAHWHWNASVEGPRFAALSSDGTMLALLQADGHVAVGPLERCN